MKLFGGSFFENVRMGLDTLWQHKLRSFLTVLGVVIGTMTVIVIAAFVSGIDQRVAKEIESFGTNSIYIYRFDPGFNFNPSAEERMRKPLSYEDAQAIGTECPSVAYSAAFMSPVDFFGGPFTERVYVRHRDIEMKNAAVQGASPSYFKMGVTNLAEGRYFTDEENALHANVIVIGNDVANTLFPYSKALDQNVSINGRLYRIVGVLAERDIFLVGAEDPNNENKAVYMPYLTLRKLYPDVDDNFMMVSVTERTREIGVRKAIGARRRDIVAQFLIEAGTLTGLGGILGIVVGSGLALLIQTLMPTYIPLWAPIVGFAVSVGLGVVFGLWPAWKAARLNPIEALRYE